MSADDEFIAAKDHLDGALRKYYTKKLHEIAGRDGQVIVPQDEDTALVLTLVVPMIDFFMPNSFLLQAKGNELVDKIAQVMNNEVEGGHLALNIRADAANYLDDESEGRIDLLIKRQSEFAASLISADVRSDLLSLALESGSKQQIKLEFSLEFVEEKF